MITISLSNVLMKLKGESSHVGYCKTLFNDGDILWCCVFSDCLVEIPEHDPNDPIMFEFAFLRNGKIITRQKRERLMEIDFTDPGPDVIRAVVDYDGSTIAVKFSYKLVFKSSD